MKKTLIFLLLLFGCTTSNIDMGDKGSRDPVNSVAIIIAMSKVDYRCYDGWDGRCSGTVIDKNRMVKACRDSGIERVVTLTDEKATTYAVIRQILLASKALEKSAKDGKSPLMVFYFSGHGGQTYDFFKKEQDSMNQTLCLWDGQLVDDLMWQTLLEIPEGVRVVHITDSCNSGTNFRSTEFVAKAYKNVVFRPRETRTPKELKCDFIHLGGCDDGKTSMGNSNWGGIFTYTLIEVAKPNGKSYYQWFDEAKALMPKINQIPVMSVIQSEESVFNNGKVEDRPALK